MATPTGALIPLPAIRRRTDVGAKAASLGFLQRHGFAVPATWVIPWAVHRQYRAGDEGAVAELRQLLAATFDPALTYAVRSSASVEDGAERSFAGQFASYLDVAGHDDLLRAVLGVWGSAANPDLDLYRDRTGTTPATPDMAVIIQEMVRPAVSGVAFSKNPLTGLDEVIVEAVAGSGAALVQDGIQPERWVHKWGAWTSRPLHSAAGEALAEQVAAETKAIAAAYGRPVDLEWVSDGERLYWLQARPITALGSHAVYSNRISREVLPGLIKPLVWSVNIPLVNGAWIRLFDELVGPSGLQPEELSRAFHYRAYFNMGSIGRIFDRLGMPRETLELLMGVEGGPERPRFKPSGRVARRLPRMGAFLAHKVRYEKALDRSLPQLREAFARFAGLPLAELSDAQLLEQAGRLFAVCREAAYANIAAPLLMYAYNGALAGGLRRSGIDPDRVDMAGDGPPGGERDLSAHLAELNRRFRSLSESEQAALLAGESDPRQPDDGGLAAKVAQFLDRFGHLSESGNDFSQPPWREQPELVWRMIAGYDAPASGEAKLRWAEVPLSPARRAGLGMLYRKARTFRTYREKVGDAYTYGYGLFRPIFRELGRRLVERDLLAAADDIFYMTWDEIRTLVAGSGLEAAPAALVSRRKGEMIEASRYHLPDIIYGEEPPPPETVGGSRDRLTGIPTARGYYRGPVRVVLTPGDFVRVEAGDAVAIPYSDVSWTPLIARAGAVISESGGTLSHSAIVAREYGLPAVLSVEGACRLLRDGMIVTVDGYRGEVIVHEDEPQGGTSG